jgi:hypothetical protein
VYCFPQTLHENGFSPVCVTRCRFIVVTQTNRLPQTPQTGKIFEERLRTPKEKKKIKHQENENDSLVFHLLIF